jgi:hypothetical protein
VFDDPRRQPEWRPHAYLLRPIQQRSATGRVLALKKTSRGVR